MDFTSAEIAKIMSCIKADSIVASYAANDLAWLMPEYRFWYLIGGNSDMTPRPDRSQVIDCDIINLPEPPMPGVGMHAIDILILGTSSREDFYRFCYPVRCGGMIIFKTGDMADQVYAEHINHLKSTRKVEIFENLVLVKWI